MEAVPVPSLPLAVSLPVCGVALALVLVQVWRFWDMHVAFLLLAVWLRYSIAVFHDYTYPPVLLGLSPVALTSILVVAVGLLVIGGRRLLLPQLVPIYLIMLVVLISAIANQTWLGAVNEIVKWLYLILLALAAYKAMSRYGSDRVLGAFAIVFIEPLALQWVSLLMGIASINEDGTPSFIGGYHHEQAFSIIVLTFLFVTCFTRKLGMMSTYVRLAIAAAGLVLANYRTTLLAAALPAAALAVDRLVGKFVRRQRSVAFVLLAVATVVLFVAVANVAQDRFADVGATLYKGTSLIQPPVYFTNDEKRLFSGRVYLWSQYLDAYLDGDIINRLIGFGPDSWVGEFPLYAHNTFVSFVYELGVFGVVAFACLLAANFLIAVRTPGDGRFVLIACHIGFFILNLATMPIWTLEGDILYALLLAYTWHRRSLQVAERRHLDASAGFPRRLALSTETGPWK